MGNKELSFPAWPQYVVYTLNTLSIHSLNVDFTNNFTTVS